jgi:hypothetical protein
MKCDLTQAAKMIGCWRLTVPRSFLVTWRRSCKRSRETERPDPDRVRSMMTGCVRSWFGASGPSLDSIWHRGVSRSYASGHLLVEQVRARTWRGPTHPVLLCWVLGRDLMRGCNRFDLWDRVVTVECRGHVALIRRLDARGVCSVTSDQRVRSSRSELPVETNDSISWGLLFKPHGQFKLTFLAICIDIATLWA